MSDQEYEQSEGVKNLREQLKKEREDRATAEGRIAELEAQQAEQASLRRTGAVKAAFTELGLPEKSVALYPSDAEVSADAIADWASTYGLSRQATTQTPSNVDGLNALMSGAFEPGTEVDDLHSRVMRGTQESYDRRTVPTAQELADHERDSREITRLHRAYAKEVQARRANPLAPNGRGGPTDPPYYANRAQQAIDAGI